MTLLEFLDSNRDVQEGLCVIAGLIVVAITIYAILSLIARSTAAAAVVRLKEKLVDRGFSADQIERVLRSRDASID